MLTIVAGKRWRDTLFPHNMALESSCASAADSYLCVTACWLDLLVHPRTHLGQPRLLPYSTLCDLLRVYPEKKDMDTAYTRYMS